MKRRLRSFLIGLALVASQCARSTDGSALSQPLVGSAVNDLPHRTLMDAVLLRQGVGVPITGGIAGSNRPYLILGKLSLVVRPSTRRIGRVLASVPDLEMLRVHARRGIALVQYEEPVWYWPTVCELPGEPVGRDVVAGATGPAVYMSVPEVSSSARPKPTRIRLVDLAPESVLKGLSLASPLLGGFGHFPIVDERP